MCPRLRLFKTVRLCAILAVISSTVLVGCKPLINQFAFHPDTTNVLSPEQLPLGIQELVVTNKDGLELRSLFLPSAQSEKLVIYFHGNAGNIYSRIPNLMTFNQAGLNVLGVGYRGYGRSEGSPSEEGLYQDGATLFQYAKEELGYAEENIFILGRSIGSTVAIETAQDKNIAGLILSTPLTSAKDIVKSSGFGWISSLAGNALDNLSKLDNLRAPLLVVHGTDDQITPYTMGVEIFEAATVQKQLITIEGGDHNSLHIEYAQEYWPPILEFIERH